MQKAVATKHNRYAPLLTIAAGQTQNGGRSVAPQMIAAAVTHLGEMSPDLIALIETCTRKFGESIAKERRSDAVLLKRRTGEFRSRFKNAIMAANARGVGNMIADASRHWSHSLDTIGAFWDRVPSWEPFDVDGICSGA